MKRYKTKILAAILCAAFILSGCDSSVDNTTIPTAEATENGTPIIKEDGNINYSHKSGIYAEQFELTLASDVGEIYYTTDGSDPSTGSTAMLYNAPIAITDRKNDKNLVSAVDPVLFSGTYNTPNRDRNDFECEIAPPADDAVDKCTVICAAAKKADGTFTEEVYLTYFIGTAEEHIKGLAESCEAAGNSLAVMSISVNYDDFFDSTKGIYVKGDVFNNALADFLEEEKRLSDPETARRLDANYKQKGKEWEREAAITLFEFDKNSAEAVLTQNCGIRIQGNYSRSDLQKGFRLYARTEYGENNFDYAVFGDDYKNISGEVMDKYDTLILRNGGNCAFTSKFNDAYWQSLIENLNCATQKSRPCVVYLNGEYWGLYILQEDYTDDYMEDYYGVNKDDVVIYKGDAEALELGYKLDEGDLPSGIADETYYFHELYEFFDSHDSLASEDNYNEFIKLVDPDSVLDYFAVQSWIDNKWDWPGKNWSMWKTVSKGDNYGDGRWRFLFYDIEFGGVCGEGDAYNNTIKNDNYKPNGLLDMDTDNPAVLCFAYLMTNDGFFNRFCEKLSGLAQSNFEKTKALERLNYFTDVYSPLFPQFFERYEGAGDADEAVNGGYATPKCIRDFINQRKKNIDRMIKYCEKTLKN